MLCVCAIIRPSTKEDTTMTIKELYEWAVTNGVQDFTLCVNYRDDGGWYCGNEEVRDEADFSINEKLREVVI